jgi:hypothetical protein
LDTVHRVFIVLWFTAGDMCTFSLVHVIVVRRAPNYFSVVNTCFL